MIAQTFTVTLRDGNEYTMRPLGGNELMKLTEWVNVREGRKATELKSLTEVLDIAMNSVHGLVKCVQLALEHGHPNFDSNKQTEVAELVDLATIGDIVGRLIDMPDTGEATDESGVGAEGNVPAVTLTSTS